MILHFSYKLTETEDTEKIFADKYTLNSLRASASLREKNLIFDYLLR
jgi:hypothetical protein